MTLAFSTQLNKIPTYFVEKILSGLHKYSLIPFERFYKLKCNYYSNCTNGDYKNLNVIFKPKFHTMRVDEHDRWKVGTLIHFVINNRTTIRYQFAPVLKCISTQKVEIKYFYNKAKDKFSTPVVMIDGKILYKQEVDELAINDGFESTKDFFAYFNTDWSGKLIHWTNKKY